jgi:hypothetical protein
MTATWRINLLRQDHSGASSPELAPLPCFPAICCLHEQF